MEGKIVIIDGNSLINRAYYAMQKPMITKTGFYTQAIFGFINMLNKILKEYTPDYAVVAWDRKTPTFRHEAYPEYKAGRKKMPVELAMEIPKMKEILEAMSITNLELDRYEADDIIGTVSLTAEKAGLNVLVITGDRDALQLASEKTHVLITKKGISSFELYDDKKMLERYGLTSEQFIDLKGLMGDKSDNIPGIPGVGEKTGIKLLKQFGSMDNLLAHTEEIQGKNLREKVESNAQTAVMSRRLAVINRNVPMEIDLESYRLKEPDQDRLIDLYQEMEFNRFLAAMGKDERRREPAEAFDLSSYKVNRINSPEEVDRLQKIPEDAEVGLKVFTNGDHVHRPSLEGIFLLWGNQGFIITEEKVQEEAVRIMEKKAFHYAGHDLVGDFYALVCNGLERADASWDTQVAQYVLDPGRSDYDITALAREYLHMEIPSEKEFRENGAQMDLLKDQEQEMADFALAQCAAVCILAKQQEKVLKERECWKLYKEVELPLVEVLAFMEKDGVDVDPKVLQEIGDILSARITELESDIYEMAGETFNINSPVQLGNILFEKLKLPAGKKTKRGYSTSADILEKIKDRHPIVNAVLEYRTDTKLKSTYVDGLKPLIGSDGRIHAHFQQTVAATGRLSCTEPNLQNIPVRQELGRKLRKAFTAGHDAVLVGADYSQIELRVLAHLSGDENLIQAFKSGEDIHRITAARVFGLDYDDVTPLDRSRAKAVNFGVIYGMSGFGLSEELHITRKDAEKYIADYFKKHPKVREYMDGQLEFCREHRYTRTILGRRRYINEIKAKNYMQRQLGERLAMNSPIQGSAADIIKVAMVRVFRALREKNLESRLILQIHDELIIRTKKEERETVKLLLKNSMESAMDLKVDLAVDMNEADSWYGLKG